MLKLFTKFSITVIAFLFLLYLLLPSPPTPPPLPNSLKSTEPGDTVQIPGVSAYYSQLDRKFVTSYYQKEFPLKIFSKISLPAYRLNHPPELAREKIRSGILTSYLEEVVVPFRETLFVNGWEPDLLYKNNPAKFQSEALIVDNTRYFSKTTLLPFYSTYLARLINFGGIFISGFILFTLIRRIIFENK